MQQKDATTKRFQRTKEDFVCENCGLAVEVTCDTNHCPRCLWSKHVDVNPGDRLEFCRGLMEPVGLEQKGGAYSINHRCVSCGFEKRNKVSAEDNLDSLIAKAP